MKHIKTINENADVVNEARAAAKNLLKSVIKGDAKDVEGIKLSKEMATAYLDWIEGSVYGKKFGTLPFNMLFDASFNWGIERYAKGKLAKELKDIKAKYKTVKEDNDESLDEAFSEWEMSFAPMILSGVKLDPKNVYKVKARTTVEAIKKAAKEAGLSGKDWMATITNKLEKLK